MTFTVVINVEALEVFKETICKKNRGAVSQ
jgi:hypothetical protein